MKRALLLVLCVLPLTRVSAQDDTARIDSALLDRTCNVPEFVSALAPLMVPKIFQDTYRLKEFIAGNEFAAYRKRAGDLRGIDALFIQAMRLSWNNRFEALLIMFFSTMDHRVLGIRLPAIGALLWFPLTPEFREEFAVRMAGLPSRLYADSPPEGDRDKLQHFFGSALLTYIAESPAVSDRVGLFVEEGEEVFIEGGVNDPRDVRANRNGQQFSEALRADPLTLPAPYFQKDQP